MNDEGVNDDARRDTARAFGLASRILLAYWEDDMDQVGQLVNAQKHDAIEALIVLATSALEQATGGHEHAIAQLREFAVRAEIELL